MGKKLYTNLGTLVALLFSFFLFSSPSLLLEGGVLEDESGQKDGLGMKIGVSQLLPGPTSGGAQQAAVARSPWYLRVGAGCPWAL